MSHAFDLSRAVYRTLRFFYDHHSVRVQDLPTSQMFALNDNISFLYACRALDFFYDHHFVSEKNCPLEIRIVLERSDKDAELPLIKPFPPSAAKLSECVPNKHFKMDKTDTFTPISSSYFI